MQLKFLVKGKPPKKGTASVWSKKSKQSELVFNLRSKALDAKKEKGFQDCFRDNIHLELKVFSPYITYEIRHKHVGDLDAFIAGVFEALQPAARNKTLIHDPIFETNPEIEPSIPLIIADDSQIVSVKAEKIKSKSEYYTVKIKPVKT